MNRQLVKNIKVLDKRIEDKLAYLELEELTDEDYEIQLQLIDTLVSAREDLTNVKATERGRWIDGKTILSSVVGLASLVMIMKYEEEDVITTKAFSMVTRMLGK